MQSWFSYSLRWFLAFLIAWLPFAAPAGNLVSFTDAKDRLTPEDRQLFERAEKTFGSQGYELKIDEEGKKAVLVDPKNPNQAALEIPFSDEKELRKFSPKSLGREFMAGIMNARPGETLTSTGKRFPYESALFFMAIGSVVAFQLFTDYASNPVRMKQHVDHSLSPLGMFSFFSFMYANGMTTNTLSVWLKNPKFHAFIPYLGMSVGYFVQSTIASFAADPNVQQCAAGMLGVKKNGEAKADEETSCEKAFNSYVIKRKFAEMAPGLVSMMASTLIAGLIQKGVTSAVLKLTGVDIALWFVPGGVGIQTVRFVLMSAVQMALFYYLDAGWLNRKITFAWKNVFDGISLDRLGDRVAGYMVRKKANGWKNELTAQSCTTKKRDHGCTEDFASAVKEFQQTMSEWRMMNLIDVYEAHQGWQEQLAGLNGLYNVTFNFYQDFVDEARNSKFKIQNPQRLEFADHLAGVTAKNLSSSAANMFYLKPQFTQNMQKATAEEVGRNLLASLSSEDMKQRLLLPYELDFLMKLGKALAEGSIEQKGAAITEMNRKLFPSAMTTTLSLGPDLREILTSVRSSLGAPTPYAEPGRGFVMAFEKYSESAPLLENVKTPTIAGLFKTPHTTEYLVSQMICGPDATRNQAVIKTTAGYPSVFVPPRITNALDYEDRICWGNGQANENVMFNFPIEQGGEKFVGLLDYNKRNIAPEIFGDQDKNGFTAWWERTTQSQMRAAYLGFSQKYDEIVIRLVRQMERSQDSAWNMGSTSNGTFPSIRQQLRYNLMILGEILKDAYQAQKGEALPANYFNSQMEAEPSYLAPRAANVPVRLMKIFKTDDVLEWDRLIRRFPGQPASKTAQPKGYALQVQKEIEHQFDLLFWQFKKIKIVEVEDPSERTYFGVSTGKRERVESTLDNTELAEQGAALTAKLQEFSDLLGVGEKPDSGIVKLSDEQREIAINALNGLMALGQEINSYGMIANSVSWDKIRDARGLNSRQERLNNSIQEQIRMLSVLTNKR